MLSYKLWWGGAERRHFFVQFINPFRQCSLFRNANWINLRLTLRLFKWDLIRSQGLQFLMREGVERWRKREREKQRGMGRESGLPFWSGGPAGERIHKHPQHIHTHTQTSTDACTHTQMHPVGPRVRRMPAVWFFFTSLISVLQEFSQRCCYFSMHLKLSHQPNISRHRWSVASRCSSVLETSGYWTAPRR